MLEFPLFLTHVMNFRVDIVDDSSSSRVEATFELPGVRNDEVTVNLHKGKLHVHGERHPRSPQPLRGTSDQLAPNHMDVDPSLHRITLPVQELKYGKFQRTLDVPSSLQVCFFSSKKCCSS